MTSVSTKMAQFCCMVYLSVEFSRNGFMLCLSYIFTFLVLSMPCDCFLFFFGLAHHVWKPFILFCYFAKKKFFERNFSVQ